MVKQFYWSQSCMCESPNNLGAWINIKDYKEAIQALRDMVLLHDTSDRKLTPEYEEKVINAKKLLIE